MPFAKLLFAVLAAVLVAGCNPVERAEEARAEVGIFHKRLNAGDFDVIWEETAPEFKRASTREQFDNLLTSMRRILGRISQTAIKMNTRVQGNFTVLTMDTHFENGRGREVFTFKKDGEQLRLVGYDIKSQDLMSNLTAKAANEDDPAE